MLITNEGSLKYRISHFPRKKIKNAKHLPYAKYSTHNFSFHSHNVLFTDKKTQFKKSTLRNSLTVRALLQNHEDQSLDPTTQVSRQKHGEAENTDGETPASHPDDPAVETAEGGYIT